MFVRNGAKDIWRRDHKPDISILSLSRLPEDIQCDNILKRENPKRRGKGQNEKMGG